MRTLGVGPTKFCVNFVVPTPVNPTFENARGLGQVYIPISEDI